MTVLCLNWDKVGLCCDPVVASVGCAWYNSGRMLCLRSAVVVLLSALTSLELSADDAVGLLRVRVDTNEMIAVEMPFVSFGDATPGAFTSGPFVGAGGSGADRLYVLSKDSGMYTNAVYSSSGGWLDPSTGEASRMMVLQGDKVVFAPGVSGMDEPLSFFLYGKVPGVAAHAGAPRIKSMSVDPSGIFAELSVFSSGLTTDLYFSDFSTNAFEIALWRQPCQPACAPCVLPRRRGEGPRGCADAPRRGRSTS